MPREDDLRCRSREGRLAHQHLVRDAGQRVEIAAAVDLVARPLLGTHVGGRAHREPGVSELLAAGLVNRPRNAEVGYQCVTAGEHDVLRLDVAMDEALTVRRVERIGDFGGNGECVVDRELLLAVEPVAERFAVDVRHHIVDEPLGLAGILHREDARMRERRRDLDLAQEPPVADRTGEIRLEDLHGDKRSVVLQVAGEVDGRHPAPSKEALDVVVGREGALHIVECRVHRLTNVPSGHSWCLGWPVVPCAGVGGMWSRVGREMFIRAKPHYVTLFPVPSRR